MVEFLTDKFSDPLNQKFELQILTKIDLETSKLLLDQISNGLNNDIHKIPNINATKIGGIKIFHNEKPRLRIIVASFFIDKYEKDKIPEIKTF